MPVVSYVLAQSLLASVLIIRTEALVLDFDAFSSREPVPTPRIKSEGRLSLENALALIVAVALYWQVL
jgi:hypothetical protein